MRYDPQRHHHRSIRLQGYDYSQAGVYFVTLCTQNSDGLFGAIVNGAMVSSPLGQQVGDAWLHLPERYPRIEMDAFVLMPNHLHAILVISSDDVTVGPIHELASSPSGHGSPQACAPRDSTVGPIHELALHDCPAPKGRAQRRQMLLPKVIGYFKMNTAKAINQVRNTPGTPVWQTDYYEHIVRNERELFAIREYIEGNPSQWAEDHENANWRR